MSLKELVDQREKKTVIVTKEKLMEKQKEKQRETIKSIVSKYQEQPQKANFNMLFKLYILQNYKLESKYFPGFNLKTLSVYKSIMNRTMRGEEIILHHNYEKMIRDFALELKEVINPFPIVEERTGRELPSVSTLTGHNLLTEEEVEMTKSEIKGERRSRKISKGVYQKTLERLYEYLAKNPTKSITTLMSKFPTLKRSTVNSLRGQFSALSRGKDEPWILDKVKRIYNDVHNIPVKKEEQVKKDILNTTINTSSKSSMTCSNPIHNRFALLSDAGIVMMPNKTEEYLRGYIAANNEFNESKLKLVEIQYKEV